MSTSNAGLFTPGKVLALLALAFAFAAHHKHKDDFIDLFAGRIYAEKPSKGLLALRKINEVHRQQSIDPHSATA